MTSPTDGLAGGTRLSALRDHFATAEALAGDGGARRPATKPMIGPISSAAFGFGPVPAV